MKAEIKDSKEIIELLFLFYPTPVYGVCVWVFVVCEWGR